MSTLARTFATGVLSALAFLPTERAQAQTASPTSQYCWVDAKTGQPAPNVLPAGARPDPFNPNQASRPSVPAGPNFPAVPGADFVRGPDGSWTNAATGQPAPNVLPAGAGPDPFNPNQASRPSVPAGPNFPAVPGQDFVRVPCPPPSQSATGFSPLPPAVPILPGIGFGFGIGGGHRGDDRR